MIASKQEALLMHPNDAGKDKALQKLQQILQEAVDGGADSIELEYVEDGLEVSYMLGGTGIGAVLSDHVLASEVIGLIIDRAKLEYKSRGVMSWMLFGRQHNITAEEYDSFGESAFRLILQKPRQKRRAT
jgi:hypothetical protein